MYPRGFLSSCNLLVAGLLAVAFLGVSCVKEDEAAKGPVPGAGGQSGMTSVEGTGGRRGQGGAGGGGTSAATGGSGGGTAIAGVSLSRETFAFVRNIAARQDHIYAFDLKTRSQRLISQVEEHSDVSSVAISLDRRWIAFGSHGFRPTVDEITKKAGALWAVSVDGKDFRRLSPVFKILTEVGACTQNSDCLIGLTCKGGQCSYGAVSSGFGSPSWTADGKTIYFGYSIAYSCIGLPPASCIGNAIGAVTDGVTESIENASCRSVQVPHYHPGTGRLVAIHTDCVSAPDGLYEWSTQPLKPKRMLVETPSYGGAWKPRWLPDASGVVFIFTDDTTKANGLALWDFATSQRRVLYERPKDDPSGKVDDVAVGPDGDIVLVLAISEGSTTKKDLHLLDAKTGKTTPLTTSGDSSSPGW